MPSPVVELNRAVAVAMAFGPQAGLELVDALTSEPALERYHLLPSVRGDLLFKLGRLDEARAEFERAASLTRNARERELLLDRARRPPAREPDPLEPACSARDVREAQRQTGTARTIHVCASPGQASVSGTIILPRGSVLPDTVRPRARRGRHPPSTPRRLHAPYVDLRPRPRRRKADATAPAERPPSAWTASCRRTRRGAPVAHGSPCMRARIQRSYRHPAHRGAAAGRGRCSSRERRIHRRFKPLLEHVARRPGVEWGARLAADRLAVARAGCGCCHVCVCCSLWAGKGGLGLTYESRPRGAQGSAPISSADARLCTKTACVALAAAVRAFEEPSCSRWRTGAGDETPG